MKKYKVLEYNDKIDISVHPFFYVRKYIGDIIVLLLILIIPFSFLDYTSIEDMIMVVVSGIAYTYYFIRRQRNIKKESLIINTRNRTIVADGEELKITDKYKLVSRKYKSKGSRYILLFVLDDKELAILDSSHKYEVDLMAQLISRRLKIPLHFGKNTVSGNKKRKSKI